MAGDGLTVTEKDRKKWEMLELGLTGETGGGGGGGGGVAPLVDRQIRGPKIGGSNPAYVSRSTRKMCEFFRVKSVVLTRCRCGQLQCVHARIRIIAYAR